MNGKGMVEMSSHTLRTVEKVRNGFDMDSHINITQLSRSTAWRDQLKKFESMQILDRNQTAAIILTPDAFRAILQYMDSVESELEKAQLELLLQARDQMNHWETGEELSRKAKESFLARQDHLRGLLNGDQ